MLGTSRSMLSLSLASSTLFSFSRKGRGFPLLRRTKPPVRVSHAFKPLCTTIPSTATIELTEPDQLKHSILLERLRLRHLKESAKSPQSKTPKDESSSSVVVSGGEDDGTRNKTKKKNKLVESFEKLGLTEELMGAVREMNIEVPTEIQCLGIAAVLDGKSVVLGSHTGSGKTLAYLLPLVQLMRQDEALLGKITRPRRPRAVVLCPTRELSEQVYRVAKSIGHHARFRSTLLSGGTRLRPQEDSLNNAVDMVVGTPGRVLQHIEDGNMVYGDIKYVVLDEADTMFDRGFGPDIRKFLAPLKHRASKLNGQDFQTVLVTATMTQAVQKLVDEEFQGIDHLRTSSLHKKIANARHDFIKLSGSENKLEALLQVLEPSLAKGNRVMVFCNTLNSSRAVDHFLAENQFSTVNYHGEVPAEQRVENLKKFKTDDGDCPTLVCTDLAARGLDLDVDHVVMFDFPMNSIDYLHRTGRTARMGAKGKVTSLVAKRDVLLAGRIEEAIRNNESLESLTKDSVRRDVARTQIMQEKGKTVKLIKEAREKTKAQVAATKPTTMGRKFSVSKRVKVSGPDRSSKTSFKSSRFSGSRTASASSSSRKTAFSGRSKGAESKRTRTVLKSTASSPKKGSRTVSKPTASSPKKESSSRRRESESRRPKTAEKLSVVGFRGRSSSRPT